jgi:hypothetical protein
MNTIIYGCLFVVLSTVIAHSEPISRHHPSTIERKVEHVRHHSRTRCDRLLDDQRNRLSLSLPLAKPDSVRDIPSGSSGWGVVSPEVIYPEATGTAVLDAWSGRVPVIILAQIYWTWRPET